MKTKTKLTLLAFAAISCNTIRAEELLVDTDGDGYADSPVKLCGGADDDQKSGPRTSGSIWGAMDDDQIVGGDGADFLRPNTTNFSFGASQTGGSLTSVQYPYKVAAPSAPSMTTDGGGWTLVAAPSLTTNLNNEASRIAPPAAPGMTTAGGGWTLVTSNASTSGLYTSVQGPYQVQGNQTNGLLTSVQYPYTLIAGGNGNDTLVAGAGTGAGPAGIIVGGVGIDYVCSAGTTAIVGAGPTGAPHITGDSGADLRTDRAILQLMTTGSLHGNDGDDTLYDGNGADTLWGDNGTDSIIRRVPSSGFVFGTTSY